MENVGCGVDDLMGLTGFWRQKVSDLSKVGLPIELGPRVPHTLKVRVKRKQCCLPTPRGQGKLPWHWEEQQVGKANQKVYPKLAGPSAALQQKSTSLGR